MTLFDEMYADGSQILAEPLGEPATYTSPAAAVTALSESVWCGSMTERREASDGRADHTKQVVKVQASELAAPEAFGRLTRTADGSVWTIETIDTPVGGWNVLNCVRAGRLEHQRSGRSLRQ